MSDNQDDLEAALRDMLAERSRRAPAAGPVAGRVLGEVDEGRVAPRGRNRRWTYWVSPVVAAGAVAAVAIALVAVNSNDHNADRGTPIGPISSDGVTSPVVPPPTQTSTPSPTTTVANPAVHTIAGAAHFAANDLTFVGTEGWAWGTADCGPGQVGQNGVCSAMLHTTDDGASWTSMAGPPANVPVLTCADPCVQSIRFASASIGYAFGPTAFFMTTDGGATWHRQAGGAVALESLSGNVIRVSTNPVGCDPGCPFTVQTAPLGSASWTSRTLPGGQPNMTTGAALVRSGSAAYLLAYGHVAGGAQDATSVLFTSTDNGASWTNRAEPCPQTGGGPGGNEVDSTAIAAAPGGSVTVLCTPRGTSDAFAFNSSDSAQTFGHRGITIPNAAQGPIAGSAQGTLLMGTTDASYRSTDGGRSWLGVLGTDARSPRWLGFESDTEGRIVAQSGSTIWTTHDAGLNWTAFSFG